MKSNAHLGSFWLTTSVIMDLVGNPDEDERKNGKKSWPFGEKVTPILNDMLKYVYLAFLLLQFILALGNKPKASKHTYLVTFVVFGVIQLYILVLAFYLVYSAFSGNNAWDELKSDSAGEWIGKFFTSNSGLIMLALCSTYGLYFVASFMYLDPWHMVDFLPD